MAREDLGGLPLARPLPWIVWSSAAAVWVGLCLLGAPDVARAVTPFASEFQVDTYTTLHQRRPSVASDGSGNFVVVWDSYGSPGSDHSSYSVQGQRYSSSGAALGGQFQVNSYTTNSQYLPSVASAGNGNFVVVWVSRSSDTDYLLSVQGQRYSSSGAALGAQFQVNNFTTSSQLDPSVSSDAAGNFVVVWQSYGSPGSDHSGYSVQGQRYSSSGAALGGQFQVNSYTTNGQYLPSVASAGYGNFVVVWQSFGSAGSDTLGRSVQGQRYDSSGVAQGGQFQVNSHTASEEMSPSVASDAAGDFAVVWESHDSAGNDNSGYSVQGQIYDSSGAAVGGQIQVNSYTTGNQRLPSVASDANGHFVVVWESSLSGGSDASGYSVQGQIYDSSGAAIGSQFQVNSYTTGVQYLASVASDPNGSFVVAWQSYGSMGSDTSGFSVEGQRYLPEPAFVPSFGAMVALLGACRSAKARSRG